MLNFAFFLFLLCLGRQSIGQFLFYIACPNQVLFKCIGRRTYGAEIWHKIAFGHVCCHVRKIRYLQGYLHIS